MNTKILFCKSDLDVNYGFEEKAAMSKLTYCKYLDETADVSDTLPAFTISEDL